jgi:hypothetical protein
MGRIGTLRARWTGLSRLGRAGLMAAALGTGAVLAGAGVDAVSGRDTPAPVVWHDQVSDGTIAPTAAH